MSTQVRTAARVVGVVAVVSVAVVGVIAMTRPARGPIADEFVLGNEAAPAGNLVFLSPDVLLCPAVNDLYRVNLGVDKGVRKVHAHREWIERVAVSSDGRRVVVASNSGLTELDHVDGQLTEVSRLDLNSDKSSIAPKAPFGDVLVGDDGSLTFTTREDGAAVYRRAGTGGPLEKVYALYSDVGLTRDLRYPISFPNATAIDPVRRRVAIAYPGGVVHAPLDSVEVPVNIALPGPAVHVCLVDAPSGTLFVGGRGQLRSFDADGRPLMTAKLSGSVSAIAPIPGRGLVAVLDSLANALPSVCRLLRTDTGESVATLPLAPKAGGKSVAVSRDGSRLAAVTGYGERTLLKVWRLADILP